MLRPNTLIPAITQVYGICLNEIAEAAAALKDWQPHIAVLEMDVNDAEGMKWLDQIRERSMRIPVVALTRRGDLKTKLDALERDVDDILTFPFPPRSLSPGPWL